MSDQPIEIVDYDPRWVDSFAVQQARLTALLSPWLAGPVEHIGSTAVPGLPAKPVVDILAPVRSLADARQALPQLEQDGWLHWAEDPDGESRMWFLRPRPQARTHHLHVIEDPARLASILAFRDALRRDARLREDYAALKTRLAQEHRTDREAYTRAKSEFVARVLQPPGGDRASRPSSDDVTLRDVTDHDMPVFFEHQQDATAAHMAAFTVMNPADRRAFLARWDRLRGDSGVTIRTILVNGQVAGHLAVFGPTDEREVTYWIGREYWRRGIATKALLQFLRDLPTRPIHARVANDNVASRRVLEKCGFTVCGHGRFFANARGREVDEVILRLEADAPPDHRTR